MPDIQPRGGPPPPAPPRILSGETIGPWRVERTLAFGDPALVAAHADDGSGIQVVLKVVKAHRMAQTWQDREVAALQSFDHPAIPRLVDSGRGSSLQFVAFRPFAPDTMADRMFAGPVDLRLACTWLYAIAEALQHMHASGWVHGDVAPQNIHVADDGRAWLSGMASAQRIGEAPRFSEELPTRTLTHLAPEVLADPDHAPPRADIYAFGCVAYELLSGESAFPAAAWAGRPDRDQMLLEWKTRHKDLDPGATCPDWLRALVRKCTRPDAQERLPDFDSVVSWLDASQGSWELLSLEGTPMLTDRRSVELPKLSLQPSLVDPEVLAKAIAAQMVAQQLAQSPPPEPRADLYYLVAASAGMAAGLMVAVTIIMYVELTWMA